MPRGKVNLTYIADESKRKASFKKRKGGLIKKIEEITTLCGIEACAIIDSPLEPQPKVWPSPSGVEEVISRFRSLHVNEQSKRMHTVESLLTERIQKAEEKVNKLRNENRKNELRNMMFQCLSVGKVDDNMNITDLNDLSWTIDQHLMEINQRLLRIQDQEVQLVGDAANPQNGYLPDPFNP